MGVKFASSQKALGECDRCGFTYKLRMLKEEIVKGKTTNLKTCPTCWDPSHPQMKLGEFPVYDPQALRDPRPDTNTIASSRKFIMPVTPIVASGLVGQVTVVTP